MMRWPATGKAVTFGHFSNLQRYSFKGLPYLQVYLVDQPIHQASREQAHLRSHQHDHSVNKRFKVSFFQRITQSVSKVFSKPAPSLSPKAPNSSLADSFTPKTPLHHTPMRSSYVKLAQAYTPSIRFVGGKHQYSPHATQMLAHPCADKGLLPNSSECLPAGEFLKKLRPFKVVPYKTKAAPKSDSRYAFTDRPLQEGELTDFSQLPSRFQFKGISDAEADTINGGGAY